MKAHSPHTLGADANADALSPRGRARELALLESRGGVGRLGGGSGLGGPGLDAASILPGLLEAEEERARQQEEKAHKNGGGNADDAADAAAAAIDDGGDQRRRRH